MRACGWGVDKRWRTAAARRRVRGVTEGERVDSSVLYGATSTVFSGNIAWHRTLAYKRRDTSPPFAFHRHVLAPPPCPAPRAPQSQHPITQLQVSRAIWDVRIEVCHCQLWDSDQLVPCEPVPEGRHRGGPCVVDRCRRLQSARTVSPFANGNYQLQPLIYKLNFALLGCPHGASNLKRGLHVSDDTQGSNPRHRATDHHRTYTVYTKQPAKAHTRGLCR